jgi:hypothetical protein
MFSIGVFVLDWLGKRDVQAVSFCFKIEVCHQASILSQIAPVCLTLCKHQVRLRTGVLSALQSCFATGF